MKIIIKCTNIKFEDIISVKYINDSLILKTHTKTLIYKISKMVGSYLVIMDTGLEIVDYAPIDEPYIKREEEIRRENEKT